MSNATRVSTGMLHVKNCVQQACNVQRCNTNATRCTRCTLRRAKNCNATQQHPIGVLRVAVDRPCFGEEDAKKCTFHPGIPNSQEIARMVKQRSKRGLVRRAGRRVGESHHMAKLTDADVAQILWLRDQGLSYGAIARKFDDEVTVSKTHVRAICLGLRRACS